MSSDVELECGSWDLIGQIFCSYLWLRVWISFCCVCLLFGIGIFEIWESKKNVIFEQRIGVSDTPISRGGKVQGICTQVSLFLRIFVCMLYVFACVRCWDGEGGTRIWKKCERNFIFYFFGMNFFWWKICFVLSSV